jgi:hypothetical protein
MGSGKMGSFKFQITFLTNNFMKIIVFVPLSFFDAAKRCTRSLVQVSRRGGL